MELNIFHMQMLKTYAFYVVFPSFQRTTYFLSDIQCYYCVHLILFLAPRNRCLRKCVDPILDPGCLFKVMTLFLKLNFFLIIKVMCML